MDTLHCELVGEKTQLCDKWRNVWYSANMSLIEGDLRIGHHHRHNHSVLPGRYAAVNDHWGLSRDDIMFFWPFTLWSLFLGLSYGFKNWGYFKWQFPLEKWWQAIWFGVPNVQKYLSEIRRMPASKSNRIWLMPPFIFFHHPSHGMQSSWPARRLKLSLVPKAQKLPTQLPDEILQAVD